MLLLDLFFSLKCISCEKSGFIICQNCENKLQKFEEICYVCKKYSKNFLVHENCKKEIFYDQLIISYHYKDFKIKNLIRKFKFHNFLEVGNFFGEKLSAKTLENLKLNGDEIILYPPMHLFRFLKRGRNHSFELGKIVSKKLNLKLEKILKKKKITSQQSKNSKKERIQNISESFSLKKGFELKGKTFVIIDDVVSTSATINEIAKLLKKNGAKKVIGVCIASD